MTKLTLLFFSFLLLINNSITAQNESFSCENEAYLFLQNTIGIWEVSSKDRTSPEVYEQNSGTSTITSLIEGCGIQESFRGIFRNKIYAREVLIIGKDSTHVEMVTLDSEHSSFSSLQGEISENEMTVYWYRNPEKRKLQSKYILNYMSADQFEFSSFLSTDYGDTWSLTHQRKYKRLQK
ncbi:MAG: DUF1579 family protein [Cyclobacteriaceae bacterium]